MLLSDLTLLTFTISNALRVFAYMPQIVSAARDRNRCAGISCSTWGMFLVGHVSAFAYAVVNIQDATMAMTFAANAMCCLVILGVALIKRRGAVRQMSTTAATVATRDKSIPTAAAAVCLVWFAAHGTILPETDAWSSHVMSYTYRYYHDPVLRLEPAMFPFEP